MTSMGRLFDLHGKTALVTGGTGYLGRAMLSALGEAGAHVLVNSRSTERCEALAAELAAKGISAEPAVFDILDQRAVEAFLERDADRPLDILINNAYAGGSGTIVLSDRVKYGASYDVTVVACHTLLMASLPRLRAAVQKSGAASVINIASMYALVSPDQRIYKSGQGANPPFYGAAKAALLQWTRYAGCEFGPEGIRVNAISPGPFPSPGVQQGQPDLIAALSEKVPLGRVGQQNEIGGPVVFLASEASSFVNGANIVVDGGWTSW